MSNTTPSTTPTPAPSPQLILALATWLLASLSGSAVHGQRLFNGIESSPNTGSFVAAPRAVQQYIREAERAIAEERWSDAVVRLGDLLEQSPNGIASDPQLAQDYFVDTNPLRVDQTISSSNLGRARRLIANLPAAGQDIYELRYGPNANRMLNEATETKDIAKLREVRRKYLFTEAGLKASIVLAKREWVMGHPLSCSMLLDAIVPLAGRRDVIDRSVVYLYAAACVSAGREISSEVQLSGPFNVATNDLEIAAGETLAGSALAEWVRAQFKFDSIKRARAWIESRMLGSSADRNGSEAGQMPLSRPKWIGETTASPREEELIDARLEQLASQRQLAPLGTQPLSVGNQVLVRTTKWLMGFDRTTGKIIWPYPWFEPVESYDASRSISLDDDDSAQTNRLVQRLWNDLPYGQVTSDGSRVFLLDEVDSPDEVQLLGRRAQQVSNTLVALELKTEGKLLWQVGAGDNTDNTTLSDAFFLGPPLPVNGLLYVIAEVAGDINLFCLDPATGQEQWRQALVSVEGRPLWADPARRRNGAMPTFHEGLLICPTEAGLIVAVDIVDRSLRWAYAYSGNTVNQLRFFSTRSIAPNDIMKRWSNGTPIAAGNHIVITPVETQRAFILDVVTGKPSIPPVPRLNAHYIAGIRGDRFFLVVANGMSARSLESGQELWKSTGLLSGDQLISGHGVFGTGDYLLPTTTNELIRLSLEDGSVLERKNSRLSAWKPRR